MRELSIRLLGRFAVSVDGEPLPADAFERRRAADLVKLLALAPGARLERDRVIEALWPQLDADAGAASLHKAATMARRALGDSGAIILRGGQVTLAAGRQLRTDVARFEAERDPDLYDGELLPEDRYEDWAREPRERLRDLYLELLRERNRWRELAAADPCDERAGLECARECLAAGDRNGAARALRHLRVALAEAGLQPSAETAAAQEDLLRGPAARAPLSGGPALAGREAELRLFDAALERAAGGRGGVLLLSGEAGAGKTRLAEELLRRADRAGWSTLRGGASPAPSERPYGALAEALSRLLADRPDLLHRLSDADRSQLARLCPELDAGAPAADPRSDRTRIFAAAGRLLQAAARERPTALLVDDLQDAGAATVELCGHLGAEASFLPALVILSYRPEEPAPALKRIRGSLLERRIATDVPVGPLAPEAAESLLRASATGEPGPQAREAILELAGGLPFFIVELAGSVGPGGEPNVPGHLYEVVNARLARLGGPARTHLAEIATLGLTFNAEELAALAAVEPVEVDADLEDAIRAGVIAEQDGAYTFRHALIREALTRGLPPRRREGAHARAAELLAAQEAPPARVAAHLLAAGHDAEAVPWLLRGAREGSAVAAYADALELVERALPHAGPPVEEELKEQLLAMRADLLLATGDGRAPAAYATAIAALGDDASGALQLRVRQARALLADGDVTGATAAIAGLRATSVADRARLTFITGMLAWFRGDIETARRCAEEARPLAVEAALPEEIEQSTQLRSAVAHSLGDWPAGIRAEITAGLNLPELAGSIFDPHHCSAEYELTSGPPGPLREAALELREEAARAGSRRAHAFAAVLAGEAALAGGEVEAAAHELEQAAELARRAGATASLTLAQLRLGEARMELGAGEAGRRLIAEATELAGRSSIPHHLLYLVFASRIEAAPAGDERAAELARAESALAGPARCVFCPIAFEIAAAGAAAEGGDTEGAGRHLAVAERSLPLWQGGPWPAALADARARRQLAAGERERAAELLAEAVAGFEAAGRPLERDRSAARLAALA